MGIWPWTWFKKKEPEEFEEKLKGRLENLRLALIKRQDKVYDLEKLFKSLKTEFLKNIKNIAGKDIINAQIQDISKLIGEAKKSQKRAEKRRAA